MIFEKEKSNGGKKTAQKFYLFILIIWYEKKKPGFVESSDSVLELETNAIPESFTNGFCTIVYKRNIALSGFLVCRLIKSLAGYCPQNCHICPWSFAFGQIFIFRTLFQPRTLSVHIPVAWWDLFTKYVNIQMYVSDSFSSIKEGVVQVTDLVGYLALYPLSTYPAGDIFK